MKKRRERVAAVTASYVCHFQPEPEGGYTVPCPSVPGMVTYGKTLDEARRMAREAIELCLEVMREQGESIPPSDKPPQRAFKELVQVNAAV
ncbi:MAG: type II toxin-antitoxin system HicB family antitoxin [Proteobacteria bacterium]|nr:type II toxin-antitoxin system HicB family antitoxin [Pseudomonadota bacterium]